MMRIAILSHVLPPNPSGQAVVLYRILSQLDSKDYYLIKSENDNNQHQLSQKSFFQLDAPYFYLPLEPKISSSSILRYLQLRNIFNLFTRTFLRVRNILGIIRRQPTTALIACSGNLIDIPAAFIACQLAHIPFYAYIFDDYVYQWTGLHRQFARIVSAYIFKRSSGLIAPNEFICEEYKQRYGILPGLVRNPCSNKELEANRDICWPAETGKIKIIYTGAIYQANFDCFRNLLQAMDLIPEKDLELHVFTAQTSDELSIEHIQSDRLFLHSHVPYNKILEQQHQADILFLPLAFQSPIPEVIRTSAPGKMGEYLASGRPILAHVPSDSFVAHYFKKYQCGGVVDQNDPRVLANMIEKMMGDQKLRSTFSQKALQKAKSDFSPVRSRDQFVKLLMNT